ncbi:N-succinyl-L-ornithine transcarbamylase [Arcticibacter tournemirensis]|uniref:N-succinylornithine carbamoyltransferase n=1 Tax=Arcticibacter tournemirensis TaxID=699437 RepID=A0A4Q0M8B9_9SPHI|nr:acetylornithine carbamoyltransferase [Arcticibacter tournemirensis]KAA8477561.1 acetylornithine carbamoyltransferase [Arcticibacter tournemirensis]RXF69039.1 acetylornithine carbamoyltransferase [Arcticibacter tournemirensis]TQM48363.1 N-succinyl-L-ornithine transcarbamylase [Arcticibacter tournemirensis]
MRLFTSVRDVTSVKTLVQEALALKSNPYAFQELGKNKTLGVIFLNPSLRTRLSTQKAAANLGMSVMVMNIDKEGWALETRDGVVMDGTTVEHIREAARVFGQYCDILAIRAFPGLKNRDEDYNEEIFNKFIEFSGVPVVSLESATLHPLQSFADLITIEEHKKTQKPKVVLTWAPHVKPLPQSVPNAFAEWMCKAQQEGLLDFVITHPEGYELAGKFTEGATIIHNQDEAIKGADFIYPKNWSGYHDYGKILHNGEGWMLDLERLKITNGAKVLHCLPVRRDLELGSDILDSDSSLVIEEAGNRVWAAQTVLKRMLEEL